MLGVHQEFADPVADHPWTPMTMRKRRNWARSRRCARELLSVDLLSDGLTVSACHAGIPTGARVIGENQPRLALRFLLRASPWNLVPAPKLHLLV
jgi:hypothetical protein